MRKALKIVGITLCSIVALALVLVGVALWMLTSSGRLTWWVKEHAPEFVTCEMQIGKADMTLFKAFPNVGLKVENVALVNQMEGSPSDAIANIDELVVVLDVKKLLKEKEIVVRKCILNDAFVNYYIDSLGSNSFDVFNTNKDGQAATPFDYLIDVEEVKLRNSTLFFTDNRNGMRAFANGFNLDLKGKMKAHDMVADMAINVADLSLKTKTLQLELTPLNLEFVGTVAGMDQVNGVLKLATPDISLDLGEPYLESDRLELNMPLQMTLSTKQLHLATSQIALNQNFVNLEGDASMTENKDVNLDVKLGTNTMMIEDVLAYLPENVQKSLNAIEYTGWIRIADATVQGTINDTLMPLVSATITTDDAQVNVPNIPFPFNDVDLEADLRLDLNSKDGSVDVKSLKTKYNRSVLNVKGLVSDLLGDIRLKLSVNGNVLMRDLNGFLPKKMNLNGRTDLDLTTNFTVRQMKKTLKDANLNRLLAKANMKIVNFSFDMDTIHVDAPDLTAHLVLPKPAGERGIVSFNSGKLAADVGNAIHADFSGFDAMFFAENLKDDIEKMLLNVALFSQKLYVAYDTVNLHVDNPAIDFVTTPDKLSQGMKADITIDADEVAINMGKDYAMNTKLLGIQASIAQDKGKTGFLSYWNPKADVVLNNAKVKVEGLDERIRMDNLAFRFTPTELILKEGSLHIGRSDFSLQGNVNGIMDWISNHESLMKGELRVNSDMLNINEILDMTSGFGTVENSKLKGDDNQGSNPFMVPEDVDFSFSLNAKRAFYDNFDLNNLNGMMTVKDGTLILQEIGFTNKAAEMFLTAMYQSPRRNNLFLAMDFHLLDVKIKDLLQMIPYIDTLAPMLKTFDGQAEFHIGAETNLKANYEPKISTLRAAADIEGKNLSVNDKFTFTKMTDMLNISTDGAYRVDSLDVQLTVFKDEIDLWPSQIAIGKYKVTLDGRMTLDKNGEYHLSVTESPLPTRFGLIVSGPLNDLDYKLEKPKFPTLYKPSKRSDTDEMYLELKKRIAIQLKENVK